MAKKQLNKCQFNQSFPSKVEKTFRFLTCQDNSAANTVFLKIFGHLKGYSAISMFLGKSGIYVFKSVQYICQFISHLLQVSTWKIFKSLTFYRLCWAVPSELLRQSAFCDIYPIELEFTVEHHINCAAFLNLNITITKGTFISTLFGKKDHFSYLIVIMLHIKRNTLKNTFFVWQSKMNFY